MIEQESKWRFVDMSSGQDYPKVGLSWMPVNYVEVHLYDPGQEKGYWERLTADEKQEFDAFIERVIRRVQGNPS